MILPQRYFLLSWSRAQSASHHAIILKLDDRLCRGPTFFCSFLDCNTSFNASQCLGAGSAWKIPNIDTTVETSALVRVLRSSQDLKYYCKVPSASDPALIERVRNVSHNRLLRKEIDDLEGFTPSLQNPSEIFLRWSFAWDEVDQYLFRITWNPKNGLLCKVHPFWSASSAFHWFGIVATYFQTMKIHLRMHTARPFSLSFAELIGIR